jgi:nitrous oxidase accessory protein
MRCPRLTTRSSTRPPLLHAIVQLALLVLAACAPAGPRAVRYGEEACGYCRMTVTDRRFGGQVATAAGRIETFDSIECLADYVNGAPARSAPREPRAWVADFQHPGTFIRVDSARFVRLAAASSPMGAGLAAIAATAPAGAVPMTGAAMTWAQVLEARREARNAESHDDAPAPPAAPVANAAVVEVSPAGPVRSVTEALRLVASGGRVRVRAGVYREPTIEVSRPVTLEGEPGAIIDGEGRRQLLAVRADDVTIRGLVLRGVGYSEIEDKAAIRITESRRCVVEGNTIEDGFFGIYLARVDGCRVEDNVLSSTRATEAGSGNGIHLWTSRDVTIARNRVRGYRDGIYFEFVRASTVRDNESAGNIRYGLHFMYSDSCHYLRNAFRRNGSGVAVMYAHAVEMTENRFEDNWGAAAYGLLLKEIADPVLERNVFVRNTVALFSDGSTRLVARGNSFTANGWAVQLQANSQDASFTGNDFAGNTFDVATNASEDGTSRFAGNWFEEYRGYDLDRDGTGDVPHRPVRLYSMIVSSHESSLVLLRSFFVDLLDAAERAFPALTPATLADTAPAMRPNQPVVSAKSGHGGRSAGRLGAGFAGDAVAHQDSSRNSGRFP